METINSDINGLRDSMIDLSIIIPTYNAKNTIVSVLETCLTSHEKLIYEILIVDDCSNDETLSLIKKYFPNESRIRILKTESNSGPGVARNIGINVAKGKYTIFLDADDFINLEIAENAIQLLELYKTKVAVVGYEELKDYASYNKENSLGKMNDHDHYIFKEILTDNKWKLFELNDYPSILEIHNYPWNKIICTSFLRSNNVYFPSLRLNEDIFPHWQILLHSERILLLNETMIYHFVPPFGNNATNQKGKKRLDALTAIEQLTDLIIKSNQNENIFHSYLRFSSSFLVWARTLVLDEHRQEFRSRCLEILGKHDLYELQRVMKFDPSVTNSLHELIYG